VELRHFDAIPLLRADFDPPGRNLRGFAGKMGDIGRYFVGDGVLDVPCTEFDFALGLFCVLRWFLTAGCRGRQPLQIFLSSLPKKDSRNFQKTFRNISF